MTAPRPDNEVIFHAARAIPDPDRRREYVREACGPDEARIALVEALLDAADSPDSLLDRTAGSGPVATIDQPTPEGPGTAIGAYKLLEPIGEGGMGTVWMAQQTQPVRRLVALKLIKAGMDSKAVIARFEAERQALALMDHPNIARVLDAGTTSAGRPYFVMDLVKGVPITNYCDEHHLTPRQRLELFIPVCQAVQHAHQKGIIHRDIKPSNVMVALYDGKPVPKVIDFGIAKAAGQPLTDKTLVTGFGNIVGTLEYMSPEQAEINQLDIDTRSDIYSLGVLLYELLAGSTPFTRQDLERAGMLEMLRVIREQEPSKPSTKLSSSDALPTLSANRGTEPAKLTRLVRGELDWIVMKALEKDRSRRYETANGFAVDVQRHLADEPVQACPPSAWYRFRKFARRNKAAIGVAGMVLFFLVLLGSGAGWALRDRKAREQEIGQESARKLALTEDGIRQALNRGTKSRAELHAILKKSGGVQQLLNQPARWELLLKTAQGELAQARGLAVRAEGSLDTEWTQAMDKLEQRLTSDQADHDLAQRLERIRLDQATWVDGGFGYRTAADEYAKAFAGFALLSDDPAAVSARLASSPIKDQLVASLDNWAWIAFRLPDKGSAGQLLALARQAAPDPAWGDRLRQLKVWRDKEALTKLVAQVPADGLSPQFLLLVGFLLRDDNPLHESWLRRAQAKHPADFWLNFELAFALQNTDPVEAAGFLRVALAVRPGNSAAYNTLGTLLKVQGKLEEAIACYREAVELDPKHAFAHFNLGNALYAQKKPDEAIACYRKAIELDPKYTNAYIGLGNRLRDQGKLDEAIVAYRKAIELDAKSANAHASLGFALREQKKLDEAIAAYRKAIELDPKNAWARDALGTALRDQGKLNEAIAAHRKAIELDPKFAIAQNNLGVDLYHQGKVDEAMAYIRKALKLDPKCALAHNSLGWALQAQGKLDEAIAAYRKAIELDPNNVYSLNGFGIALCKRGKLNDGIAVFRQAIKLKPDYGAAHYNLGESLKVQGKIDQAIVAYEKVIELEPDHAFRYHELAWLMATCPEAKFRDPKRALQLAKKAVELAPREGSYWNTLGAAHYRTGNWKDAVAALEKSMALRKRGDSNAWFFLAMAHWKMGDKEGAHKWYHLATEWVEKNQPKNEELRRFRAEAEELLGVKEKK